MGPSAAEREDRAREPLDRDRVVRAAVELADAEGVAALSMRNLARHLGYEVMSLYNHVANKDELLAAMVDLVAGEVAPTDPTLEPLAAVRAQAVTLHDVLVTHRWAPELWQRHFPGPERVRLMEELLRLLDESGLSSEVAHHGFHAVTNHVLGYTIQQIGMESAMPEEDMAAVAMDFVAGLSPEEHPRMIAHVHQHLEGDTSPSFELVLDLILDGLVRLDGS